MTTKTYKSKGGRTLQKPVMTEKELWATEDDNAGFCLACGEEAYGVEPDARRYECEGCGEKAVFGYQELALMGLIELVD